MGFCKTNNFHGTFALIVLVHGTEGILGELCAPSSLPWRRLLSMRVTFSCQHRARRCPVCHRVVSGCVPEAGPGRDGLSPAGPGRSLSHTRCGKALGTTRGKHLGKDAHAAGSSLWMTTAISRQVASPVPFAGGKGIIPRSPWQERSPWHVPPHAYLVYSKWSYKSVE